MNVLFETVSRMEEVSVLSEQVGTGIPSAGAVFEITVIAVKVSWPTNCASIFVKRLGTPQGRNHASSLGHVKELSQVHLFSRKTTEVLGATTPFWGSAGRLFAICRGLLGPQTDDGPGPKGA